MGHSPPFSRATRLGVIIGMVLMLVASLAGTLHVTSAQGDVLLDDQFNDNSNGWKIASTSKNSAVTVGDGVLTIEVKKAEIVGWATPDLTFPHDITMQVEVTTPEPPDAGDWNAGLLIRADARDTSSAFYQFDVTGKGSWAFTTRTARGEEYKVQKSGKLDDWDPTASNVLKVEASGNSFAFTINDTQVGVFEDDAINNDPSMPKYVGLLAGSFKGVDSLQVEFRNLTITGEAGAAPTATATKRVRTPTRTPTPKGGKSPTRVPSRTPTPTESADNGVALLEETFPDDNPNEWTLGKGVKTSTEVRIADNSLIIEVGQADALRWSHPDAVMFPADVDVTVTATITDADPNGDSLYGIIVRGYVQNKQDYLYMYVISTAGKWQFARLNGSNGIENVVKQTTIKSGIFEADSPNTLRVVAVGSRFTFYLNGKKVGEATDSKLKAPEESYVALLAGTFSSSEYSTTAFTDLTVLPAPE